MRKQNVTIDDVEYEVRQLPMKLLRPALKSEPEDVADEILKVAVYSGGEPIGDAIDEMSFQHYSKLMVVANDLNGLLDEPAKS